MTDLGRTLLDALLSGASQVMPPLRATSPPPAEGEPEVRSFALTDLGNAERLVHYHGRDLRWLASTGQWAVWNGVRYVPDETGEVVRRATHVVRCIPREAEDTSIVRERADAIRKHAAMSEGVMRIGAMIELVKAQPGVSASHTALDADPWLLNCPNGTIDLRKGELITHRREHLLTKLCPVEFDPEAACPIWEQTLALIFPVDANDPAKGGNPALISFLRRLFGLCLTASIEAVLPIFWGGGANGKSTILNTVRAVMGPGYAMQAPHNFLMSKQNESHPTELADLLGQRLVIATESRANRRIDEALVKWLTGGERIRARRMRQDNFEFDPTHKLILCTNHRPRIGESDDGIWRRVMLIPFLVRFWNPARGEVGPDHLRQDRELPAKLLAEAAGVLAWMVRGCLEYQAEGLHSPAEVERQTTEYRSEEDVVGLFLGERLEIGNTYGHETLKDVYDAYKGWCEQTEERFLSTRQFAAELRRRGHRIDNGPGNKVVCHGFKLVDVSKRSLADIED